MKTVLAAVGAFAVGLAVFQANAADDTIKVAYIDPLSGPFANVGDAGAKHFSYMFERVNAAGGVLGGKKFELVTFDNKSSPKESLVVLRNVIDQGIQYITQGNGSHVAGALIQAVEKHNRRNPDSPILFLNYAAVNPALTNEQCSFWHFRFDANSEIKLQAITDFIKDQPSIKKVYLINQDYAHGHVISKVTKEMLAKKRPDIEIVGDDLHPIGKVKDFSPYVAKIKASGADTVITGNWGNDLSLLVKAGRDAGLDVDYLTYYGGGLGAPSAIGAGRRRPCEADHGMARRPAGRGKQARDGAALSRVHGQVQARLLLRPHQDRSGDAGQGHGRRGQHRSARGRQGAGGHDP